MLIQSGDIYKDNEESDAQPSPPSFDTSSIQADKFTVCVLPRLVLTPDKLAYFFDRMATDSFCRIPMPVEWVKRKLTLTTPEQAARYIAKAVEVGGVFNVAGDDGDPSTLNWPYYLTHIARASAIAAGNSVCRCPYFSVTDDFFARLEFPWYLNEGGYYLEPHDFVAKPPRSKKRPMTPKEIEWDRKFRDEDLRLTRVIGDLFDNYQSPYDQDYVFQIDQDLVNDGNALYGNMVYKNDEFSRLLGKDPRKND